MERGWATRDIHRVRWRYGIARYDIAVQIIIPHSWRLIERSQIVSSNFRQVVLRNADVDDGFETIGDICGELGGWNVGVNDCVC